MLFESNKSINRNAQNDFNWILTKFILFELNNSYFSFPIEEIYKIDLLIKFHEELENYELCAMLLNYKNKCLNKKN